MRRKLSRTFHRLAVRATRSPIRRLPGARTAYRVLADAIAPSVRDEPAWIEYRGFQLSVDPSISEVGRSLYRTGEHELFVREVVDELVEAGDTVVDVGGHFGHHALSARSAVGEGGRVVVFEPHPALVRHLEATVQRNDLSNVEVVRAAASDRTGTAVLHGEPGRPDNAARSRLDTESRPTEGDSAHEVRTVRLEDALADRGIDRVDFLKVDVEGHEAAAVEGLGDVIEHVGSLLVEVHDVTSDERRALDDRLSVFPSWVDVHDGRTIESLVGEDIEEDGHVHLLCRRD